jgi:hypothetical protein
MAALAEKELLATRIRALSPDVTEADAIEIPRDNTLQLAYDPYVGTGTLGTVLGGIAGTGIGERVGTLGGYEMESVSAPRESQIPREKLRTFLRRLPRSEVEEILEAAIDVLGPGTRPGSAMVSSALHAAGSGQTMVGEAFTNVVFGGPGNLTVKSVEVQPFTGLIGTVKTIGGEVIAARPADDEGTAAPVDEPPAYRAFKDLADWLEAREDEVADAVEIGRTTPYSWVRDSREPRRGTAQRIYEFHAVLSSLLRRLGRDGLRTWLFNGDPNPRELMLRGDLEATDRLVHDALFRPADTGVDLAWAPEPDETETAPASPRTGTSRPSGRKVRRARVS